MQKSYDSGPLCISTYIIYVETFYFLRLHAYLCMHSAIKLKYLVRFWPHFIHTIPLDYIYWMNKAFSLRYFFFFFIIIFCVCLLRSHTLNKHFNQRLIGQVVKILLPNQQTGHSAPVCIKLLWYKV